MKTLKEIKHLPIDFKHHYDIDLYEEAISKKDLRQSAIDDIKKFRFDSNYLKQNLDGKTMTPEDYRVFQVSYDFVISYIKDKFNVTEDDLK